MRRKLLVLVLSGLLMTTSSWTVAADQDFADIQGHWGEQVIIDITSRELMQGIGSNEPGQRLFAPDMLVNRAQIVSVLERVFKLGYGSKRFIKQPMPSSYYHDIDDNAWYAHAAMICAINEIFPPGNHFYPEQPISRLEIAQAIKRCFAAREMDLSMMAMPIFSDLSALSSEELNAVAFVDSTGIMRGDGQKFRPADSLNRAELAQILKNCLNVIENAPVSTENYIGESYNGNEYTIQAYGTFTLGLESNPTTGFQWMLSRDFDHNIILLSDSYYSSPLQSDPPVVGQGGTDYWVFKALRPGSTELKLTCARPWESVQPVQTFAVKITVTDDPAAR